MFIHANGDSTKNRVISYNASYPFIRPFIGAPQLHLQLEVAYVSPCCFCTLSRGILNSPKPMGFWFRTPGPPLRGSSLKGQKKTSRRFWNSSTVFLSTSFFQVTLWSPKWRSLNPWTGHLTHPKGQSEEAGTSHYSWFISNVANISNHPPWNASQRTQKKQPLEYTPNTTNPPPPVAATRCDRLQLRCPQWSRNVIFTQFQLLGLRKNPGKT